MANTPFGAPSALYAWLQRHPVGAFLAMTLAFMFSGALTLDMAKVLTANLTFLGSYGWQAVLDAGLWQLLGLVFKGLLATSGYLFFKVCEAALVNRFSSRD